MKHFLLATLLVGASTTAMANDSPRLKHRFTEFANVVNVEPVFKQVRYERPEKECWIEQQEQIVTYEGSTQSYGRPIHQSRGSSGGDVIIGGIIGGVIGNQIGRHGGRGTRNGATVAGAIIGSALANESRSSNTRRHRRHQRVETVQPRRVTTTKPVERCRETMHTTYEQRVQAYDVTYEYRGRTFTTRMKRDPGNQIELQVNVVPARH